MIIENPIEKLKRPLNALRKHSILGSQVIFFKSEAEIMCEVPEALPGRQGVLPALSRALLLEPGELGKSRLPCTYSSSAFRDHPILAVSLSGYLPEVKYKVNMH